MKTILIAGGSGFIGKNIEFYFSKKGYQVKILSRNPKRKNEIFWNARDLNDSWIKHLENLDVLINLTGKNINCRFTDKNKKLIKTSRVDATHVLGKAIDGCKNPPKVWMNASTTSIYKESFDVVMDENHHELGNDFENDVATSWEDSFNSTLNTKTRKIIIRISLVFGQEDGAFVPLKKLTQFGLGGKQGTGKQKVSWIHKIDFARAIDFLIENQEANGAFNFCAPKPTNNATLMKTFRKVLGVPFGFPHPKIMLEIGAFFMQTETELILKSRNVIPKKLLDLGFSFKFGTIESALKDLVE